MYVVDDDKDRVRNGVAKVTLMRILNRTRKDAEQE